MRELQDAGVKDLRGELNALRAQSSQLGQEKDELIERMKKISDKIRAQV